jgi:hypothetical protein
MPDTPFEWAWNKDTGVISEPLDGSKVIFIAPEDIAAVAVKALLTEGRRPVALRR